MSAARTGVIDRWAYFGCRRGGIGHGLEDERGQNPDRGYGSPWRYISSWDGILPPHPELEAELYQATISRLPGLGMSVLAWWDRSGDTRPASNSAIYAPHPEAGPDWLHEEAQRRFPWVFARLPQPLVIRRPLA